MKVYQVFSLIYGIAGRRVYDPAIHREVKIYLTKELPYAEHLYPCFMELIEAGASHLILGTWYPRTNGSKMLRPADDWAAIYDNERNFIRKELNSRNVKLYMFTGGEEMHYGWVTYDGYQFGLEWCEMIKEWKYDGIDFHMYGFQGAVPQLLQWIGDVVHGCKKVMPECLISSSGDQLDYDWRYQPGLKGGAWLDLKFTKLVNDLAIRYHNYRAKYGELTYDKVFNDTNLPDDFTKMMTLRSIDKHFKFIWPKEEVGIEFAWHPNDTREFGHIDAHVLRDWLCQAESERIFSGKLRLWTAPEYTYLIDNDWKNLTMLSWKCQYTPPTTTTTLNTRNYQLDMQAFDDSTDVPPNNGIVVVVSDSHDYTQSSSI